jgi:hypothetical protein
MAIYYALYNANERTIMKNADTEQLEIYETKEDANLELSRAKIEGVTVTAIEVKKYDWD